MVWREYLALVEGLGRQGKGWKVGEEVDREGRLLGLLRVL
jgi:hypothetical protein